MMRVSYLTMTARSGWYECASVTARATSVAFPHPAPPISAKGTVLSPVMYLEKRIKNIVTQSLKAQTQGLLTFN